MALLLQSYQEKRELTLQRRTQPQPTKTLGIQTSLETIDSSSCTGTASGESTPCAHPAACTITVEIPVQSNSRKVGLRNNDIVVDVEPTSVAFEVDPDL
jgi:hypothetical protein